MDNLRHTAHVLLKGVNLCEKTKCDEISEVRRCVQQEPEMATRDGAGNDVVVGEAAGMLEATKSAAVVMLKIKSFRARTCMTQRTCGITERMPALASVCWSKWDTKLEPDEQNVQGFCEQSMLAGDFETALPLLTCR